MDTDNSFCMCFPCQMDGIISFARRVAPYAFDPIQQEVGYLIFYEGNFTKLTSYFRNLQGAREAINNRVEAERKNGKRIEVGVQNWLEEVNEIIERSNQLLEDPRRLEVGFSWWPFPNLISRYQLSRIATEVANEAAEVWGRREFNQVAYLPALDETASSSATGGGEKFETRESFKDSILKALKDPKSHNVGVYGMGGVGKTTLVKEVAEIAKQQKWFDAVVIAHVSQTPDIKEIQGVIADKLGLRFEEETTDGRAYRLKKRIEDEKTFLVILDDIWPKFELEKVGIPSSKEHNGCKLLMTSRTKDVLLKLDVKKDFTFRLEPLSETETWILFQSMAGDVVNDIRLRDLATEVANKCAGLPLLIVTVARGLKSKDVYAWKNALSKIKSDGHKEMKEITSSVLELSYEWLDSDEIKALFLLSAILGDSSMDYLLKVAMGLDIFRDINTVDNARDRFHSIIQSLKESCLLLESSTSRRIQMHDDVRDVAISIAQRDKHVYLVKSNHELEECIKKDLLKRCSHIILWRQIHGLPQRLDCPNVKLFYLVSANRSLEIPDTVFEGMESLKVLDLTRLNLVSLPTSFRSLNGLHTLCLDQCILENIDIIGDLKNLEILSLWKSSMIKLSNRIGELTQLRMLDLSNSGIEVIPPNIISRLTKLEELYMGNTSIKWKEGNSPEQKENANLAELQNLYNLTALELHIHEAGSLTMDLKLMFEKLQRYKIVIGDVWEWSDIEDQTLKTLMLKLGTNINLEHGIKALIKGVENLYLDEVDGIQNVLYQMNEGGFPLLKHLHIQNNANMKHIVYSMKLESNQVHHVSFPNLETLLIQDLENLEYICYGPVAINSFAKLSVIKVKNSGQLKYLLSLSMVKGLSYLSEIEVCQCNSMKNIVLGNCNSSADNECLHDEKIEFRSLRSLTLQHLQILDNFFSYELTEQEYQGQQSCVSTPLFSAQIAFSNLDTLKLSSLNLKKIWDDNEYSMKTLKILIVENCGGLEYLFSSTMVKSFENLMRLEISKCCLMNEIVATEQGNSGTIALDEVPFPKLETIILKDMENLKTIWHWQFDTVKTLRVQHCDKVVVVFPSSMQKTFHNLETLVVKDCALVEEIFQLTSSENSSIDDTTHLKIITLDGLPMLKRVWSRDSQGILSFHNLQSVYLNKCGSMEYLFPISIATGCSHLEKLNICDCWKMKEIVSQERESTRTNPIFQFNQLNSIFLWNSHELKGFYAGNHILACPSLRKIDVFDCPKLNLYKTKTMSTSSLERCRDEKLSLLFQQSLFIIEEVIPNLEWMVIDQRDAEMIYAQNLDSHFTKLTFLGLLGYQNVEAKFPYRFLQNARALECLSVEWSSFKKIFEDEGLVSMRIHTQLKDLLLNQLPKLQHICEEGSQILSVLELLEYLTISYCPSLTSLLPSSVTFSHLIYLEITNCNRLINLIASHTAQSLVKLRTMKVKDCNSLQEIIIGEENVDIAFVSLEILILECLPRLNKFCSSKCFLKFPLLEQVVVSKCPRMKIFSEGNTFTPILRKVRIEENDDDWNWKENLNETIKKMFEDKVAFCKFEHLALSYYPELKSSWYGQLHHNMFCNLKSLVVQRCGFLSNVLLPSNVLQVLHRLETLEVRDCESLEALFDVKGLKSKQSSQLKRLTLSCLPNLKHIWSEDPYEIISFGNLSTVYISFCQSLLYIFPLSLCQDLVHLTILGIKSCGVEQIVAMEERLTKTDISFPQLTQLRLIRLKNLRSFYPGKHTLECPSLKILNVYRCETFNMFSFNHFDSQQNENDIHDDILIGEALFSIEKLSPNLEQLAINSTDAITILRCYSQENIFLHKLEFLRLQCFEETPTSLLNDFHAIFPNLASLQVRNSSFETLFPTPGTINDHLSMQTPKKIRKLWLFELEKLKYIWQEDFPLEHSLLKDLEILEALDCPSLISLVPSSTSFTNLTSLIVENCKELGYLITSSTAKSLVQLTALQIRNCEKLLDVVKIDEEKIDENIVFENLEYLELTSLPSFRSFCFGKHKFIFPSLICFIVKGCPQMKIFSSGVTIAPYLTSVEVENEEKWWEIDLNTTIEKLFMEKVSDMDSLAQGIPSSSASHDP